MSRTGHLNTMLNPLDRKRSMMPINIAKRAVIEITTMVAPMISWRVDQETLLSSCFTSDKKFVILLTITIYFLKPIFQQGRRDSNPQDGIWSLAV